MTPERFRELRLKHNLTQERLAHILGVSVRNVQQFEQLDGESSRKPNPIACKVLEYIDSGLLDITNIEEPETPEYKSKVLAEMEAYFVKMGLAYEMTAKNNEAQL